MLVRLGGQRWRQLRTRTGPDLGQTRRAARSQVDGYGLRMIRPKAFAALRVFVGSGCFRQRERAVDFDPEFPAGNTVEQAADHLVNLRVSDSIAAPRKTPRSELLRAHSERASIAEPARAATPTLTRVPR